MLTLLLCALSADAAQGATPLSFEEVRRRAKTSVEELRVESDLSERAREIAATSGFLREGPTLSVEAGPRFRPGEPDGADVAVSADAPLVLSRGTSAALGDAFRRAASLLVRAARVEADLALERAYLDAWLGERLVSLHEADVATVEAWLRAARARRDAGADPAFQSSLVEGELVRAEQELLDARALRREAWGRLVARADLPTEFVALDDAPRKTPAEARVERSLLWSAMAARRELSVALLYRRAALSSSLFSLKAGGRREGDEHVATLGLAVRVPLRGEAQAIRGEVTAAERTASREEETAQAELEARLAAALERLGTVRGAEVPRFEEALAAVALRLSEGRERPSDALPIRRQLLEAQIAVLRREHARRLALAELAALREGVEP